MNKHLVDLVVAAAVMLSCQATLAQAPARADVKKDTADANKAGQIPGTGTGPSANTTPPITAQSQTSRAEVKKQAAAANKAGEIPGSGMSNVPQQATGQQSPRERSATSTVNRDERKQATAEANKAGAIPQTEAQMQSSKK